MGMNVAAGHKGGRRRRGVPRYGAMAEINMTPFIDVMLVLLIIFMVAAPLLVSGLPIDLPQTAAGPLNVEAEAMKVAIDTKGETFVNDKPVPFEQLVDQLKTTAKDGFDERIFISADKGINYGRVAEVMAALSHAGYAKVALVTTPKDDSSATPPGALK